MANSNLELGSKVCVRAGQAKEEARKCHQSQTMLALLLLLLLLVSSCCVAELHDALELSRLFPAGRSCAHVYALHVSGLNSVVLVELSQIAHAALHGCYFCRNATDAEGKERTPPFPEHVYASLCQPAPNTSQ